MGGESNCATLCRQNPKGGNRHEPCPQLTAVDQSFFCFPGRVGVIRKESNSTQALGLENDSSSSLRPSCAQAKQSSQRHLLRGCAHVISHQSETIYAREKEREKSTYHCQHKHWKHLPKGELTCWKVLTSKASVTFVSNDERHGENENIYQR